MKATMILACVTPLMGAALSGCQSESSPAESASTNPPSPLACSLTPEDLRDRRDALLPGLIHSADTVTELDNGLRLEFESRPGILAEIARIMEQERGCCTFLIFNLKAEAEDGPITFDVTGPEGTREVLRSL